MDNKPQRMGSTIRSIDPQRVSTISVSVDCALFGFEEGQLKILLKQQHPTAAGPWILPGTWLRADEDLDQAAVRLVAAITGIEDTYIEQVKTVGKKNNHPSGRVISTAHYGLINLKNTALKPLDHGFQWQTLSGIRLLLSEHKAMVESCLSALQRKIQQEPIAFNLLPEKFSLRDLQHLYEGILGTEFDRRNFRKKLFATGFLRDQQEMEKAVRHRPGKLYTFDRVAYSHHKIQFPSVLFF